MNTSPFNISVNQDTDKYAGEPVSFYDKGTHYELTFTGEFGSMGRDNHVFTDLITDLREGVKDLELHIFISSVGGDCETLSSILQQVLLYKHRVTVCSGLACSAGFLLWASGHERYASPFSELMYHSPACYYEAKISELNTFSRHMGELSDHLIDAVGLHELLSPKDIETGKTTEVWYTGSDFIKKGKAKDYAGYETRQPPQVAAIYLAAGRMFLLGEGAYTELKATGETYSYTQLVDMSSQREQKPENKTSGKARRK